MSNNKIIKSVSFNVTNSDDKKMLDHLKRRNFSGYVKKLIMREIDTKNETKGKTEPKTATVLKEEQKMTVAERLEQLKKERNSAPDRIKLKVDGKNQDF
jgi:hypothetical protein